MGFRSILSAATLIAFLTSTVTAQNQAKTSTTIGTASSKTESHQVKIAANTGCATFNFTNTFQGFNYTAALGLADLPTGCSTDLIRVVKQYTYGACPKTRANNYKVASSKNSNTCSDGVMALNDPTTCQNIFANAPPEAFAPKGVGAGSIIDTGNVCWPAPLVFYFIENGCSEPITATVKLTSNVYTGKCTNAADSDDGGDDAGGPGSSEKSSKSGLSTGAKVGIAIGVIAAVAIIAAASWFLCCQIRA